MAASGNKGPAILGNEDGDSSNPVLEMGDDPIPNNQFSLGQGLNLGIINQYGQLMGEYSRLDDDLWLSKSQDDEAVERSNEGLQWDFVPSSENAVNLEPRSDCLGNSVCDGAMTSVNGKSCSLNDTSQNQSQLPSPVSVLQTRRSDSDVRNRMHSQSQHHQPMKHNFSGGCQTSGPTFSAREHGQGFQSESEYSMESSSLDGSEDSNSALEVRTRKITDLLDLDSEPAAKKCLHCETTETPQWRPGPMGRKTLCNACGVQYKHGRLFPDYRPLRSPTFDPSLHTNLPKKVQETRLGETSELCPTPTPKPKIVEKRTPEFDLSLRSNLDKKVRVMIMGTTSERCPPHTPKPKKVDRSPTLNSSLLSKLDKKVQEMIMGKTSERCPPHTPKPKKVDRSPAFNSSLLSKLDKKVQKMIMGQTSERCPTTTPKPKEVEEKDPDYDPLLNSRRVKALKMRTGKTSGRHRNLTIEPERVEGMRLGINKENDQNRAQRAKKFQEMREGASNLLQSDSRAESNESFDSKSNLKRKLPSKVVKMCRHCESRETPQWREGPTGQKTLCNACGVQYRNGRLFPEYRPLKSPTYDPSLHSHLPKKVQEMRMSNSKNCATSGNSE